MNFDESHFKGIIHAHVALNLIDLNLNEWTPPPLLVFFLCVFLFGVK